MSKYHNPDGTMKDPKIIKNMWLKQGIDINKRLVFYCGTGWRASEAFFYALVMGIKNITVYDGGWFEWSSLNFETTE